MLLHVRDSTHEPKYRIWTKDRESKVPLWRKMMRISCTENLMNQVVMEKLGTTKRMQKSLIGNQLQREER